MCFDLDFFPQIFAIWNPRLVESLVAKTADKQGYWVPIKLNLGPDSLSLIPRVRYLPTGVLLRFLFSPPPGQLYEEERTHSSFLHPTVNSLGWGPQFFLLLYLTGIEHHSLQTVGVQNARWTDWVLSLPSTYLYNGSIYFLPFWSSKFSHQDS